MKRSLSARWAGLLLAALLLLPPALLLRLEFNNAPEVYFPSASPAVRFEQALREYFPEDQVLLALFEGEDLYSERFLSALQRSVQRLEAHPLVERVLAVTTVDHITGTEDGFSVEPLIDPRRLALTSEEERRQRVLSDRFAPGLLAAEDGSALALVVRPHELADSRQGLALEQAVRDAIAEAGLAGQLTAVAGHVPLDVAELRSMVHDTLVFTPLTLAVGLALLAWMFRRLLPVLLGGVVIGVVVNGTLALGILWGKPYTLVSSIIPPLMAALSVAVLIHLYSALAHAAQCGLQGVERVRRALEEVRQPSLYSVLTTAAGLASLALNPIQPIQTFGLTGALGMLLLYGVVVHLLPPLFARFDRRPWPVRRVGLGGLGRLACRTAALGIRYPGRVALIALLGLVVTVPLIAQVRVETDLYRFFLPEHPLSRSTERVEDKLTGVTTLEVVFTGPARDAFTSPERLRLLRTFQTWAQGLPGVDRSLSMVDVLEEMNRAFHAEDPAARRLPDNRELIAQYLLIYDGQDLYELVDRDLRRARVTLNLETHGTAALQATIAALRGFLQALPAHDLEWEIAGAGRLLAEQEALLVQGQVHSLAAALGLIFLLLVLFLRSVTGGALCMIPNIAPILFIFALMGVLGIWLDFATAMIASVAIGIAVDDTIHLYYGYQRQMRLGSPRISWALARTYRQAGRAVVATTLILCLQFALLIASRFQPTREFGLLTTVGLLAALLFDLLLLPALLMLYARVREPRGRRVPAIAR